ncbi:SMP-30/gluconolactonase/LRE family protein [Acetobacter estunensis]|uniref:SMP-30/gluconolactonase/LRE family protein n=1 Tax=Acetobacter estunensis TaxID=104097 RepID=UPI001C2D4AB6|nr:SMP-30/gluconolactonase/LRE family protein [Acetobacter estunensis]MBV1836874.1 SMP-30/gluconolactonase/LRE family protein [Acetobacter estunensis]
MTPTSGRRAFLGGTLGALLCTHARAAVPAPPDVTTHPPRQWDNHAPTGYLPDPDVIALDPSFKNLLFSGASLERVLTGGGWLEGPTWLSEARLLLLSDTIHSEQYRFIPPERMGEEGSLSLYRAESYHSNGNTLDTQDRIITCEHDMRRVIRWEHDGSCHVVADAFEGKPLNSPNDVIVHPQDGSIWFTDPAYGDTLIEGHPDAPGGRANRDGKLRWQIGSELPVQFAGHTRQDDHVFRVDGDSGKIEAVLTQDQVLSPNGLCFSPDLKTFYVISTMPDPGQTGTKGSPMIHAFDMVDGRPRNGRIFTDMKFENHQMMPDGMRADVFGNLWCGASGPFGLAGVFCFNPAGELIGHIRLPYGCSNLTFGGVKRNELYMCCGHELYRLLLETQGAGLS